MTCRFLRRESVTNRTKMSVLSFEYTWYCRPTILIPQLTFTITWKHLDSQPHSVVQGKPTRVPNNPNRANKTTTEEVAERGLKAHELVLTLHYRDTRLKTEHSRRGLKVHRGGEGEVEVAIIEEEEVQG